MKFNFTFQKVLDVKEKEKDRAQQEYGTVRLKQLELEEQMESLEQARTSIFNEYNSVDRKTVWQVLEVQQEMEHINLQLQQLEQQSQLVTEEAEARHQILIEKTQEAKMWNQWKSKAKLSFQKQIDQKEQAMLDEMALLRYSRRV